MKAGKKVVVKGATGAVELLWENGLLKEWKDLQKIVDILAGYEYHFTAPELGMALKRAKFLTRKGTRGSYEYIQKFPYVEEESE